MAKYTDCERAERLWSASIDLGRKYHAQGDGVRALLAVRASNALLLRKEWMDALEATRAA